MRLVCKAFVGWMVSATAVVGFAIAQPGAPAINKAGNGSAAPAANGEKEARKKKSVEQLLQQGLDALAAGQYQPAREAFLDVIAADPRSVKAHHGLALCQAEQKEFAKAAATLEKAFTLTTTPDRALVLNGAAANMAQGYHMRAAKLIKDYLTRVTDPPDEPMANALGTALSAATPNERKNRFFSDCAAFYITANQRLEKARPGYKRFGAEWYTVKEAEAKAATVAAKQKQLDALSDAIATAEERMEPAVKEFERQKWLITKGETPGNYYYTRAEAAYDAAKAAVVAAEERYDALAGTIEQPKFPAEIAMVTIDATTPPAIATDGVASAEPTPAVVKPKPRPVRPKPAAGTTGTDAKPPEITLAPPKLIAPRRVRITQYAAAFPVAGDLVVTSAALVAEGAELQLQSADGQSMNAQIVRKDDNVGLALLRVTGKRLNPLGLADSFAGGRVKCASFPSVDLFSPAAQAIDGSATPPKGEGWTVSLSLHPRLAGAPLLSGESKVVGVCIAPRDAEKGKLPAVTLEQLKTFLGADAGGSGAASANPTGAILQLVTTRESGGE